MSQVFRIWPHRDLILHKAWADFREESSRTYLGVVWWILDPLINIAIYFLVFGVFFNRGIPDYVPFLTIGIVLWLWFFSGVNAATRSILSHVGFVRQVSFHKVVFPLSRILMSTYQFGFSLVVLVGVLAAFGFFPGPAWLLFPVVLLAEFVLILGAGLLLAAFAPFVPDLVTVVNYVLRLVFFLSAVMYSLEMLGPRSQAILVYNPMVHVITAGREVLMHGRSPDWAALGAVALFGGLCTVIGTALIARFNRVYAKRIVL